MNAAIAEKRGNMKKVTVIVTVVLMIVVMGVVGVFAYLSGRDRDEKDEATLSNVERLLYRDLDSNYPATVKEVVSYYSDIIRCFYAEDTTEEELEQLGMKARELFDSELLENNETQFYLMNLKADVKDFRDSRRFITNVVVASSINVDTFKEDGYEFARISCGYNILEKKVTNQIIIVYLLRRDENRRWKIYGWEDARNVNVR